MVKLFCCLVQIRWWYNMTSSICYKSHYTSHFSNLWVFPITHSDQIKPCIEHAGFLSSYILTNSIFQYTHYGMWTFKWMQQFHLKVISRYYNRTLSLFYLDVCFLQIHTLFFLLLRKFKQKDIHCMCVMHLQERKICVVCVGKLHQWDYWGSCTRRNLKVCMSLTRGFLQAMSSLFVANGDFLNR